MRVYWALKNKEKEIQVNFRWGLDKVRQLSAQTLLNHCSNQWERQRSTRNLILIKIKSKQHPKINPNLMMLFMGYSTARMFYARILINVSFMCSIKHLNTPFSIAFRFSSIVPASFQCNENCYKLLAACRWWWRFFVAVYTFYKIYLKNS